MRTNSVRIISTVVPEAQLEDAGAGLVPASAGWFVMNARDARWFHRPGRGDSVPLTGSAEFEAETYFPMLGMSIQVLPAGEPNGTYHWETEQEDFLVLAGECLLVIEGEERRLRPWDFVHCPPWTEHVFVGAGSGPCVFVAVGARGPDAEVRYTVVDAARKYDACVPVETSSQDEAYERFSPLAEHSYRNGDLPDW